MPDHIRCKTGRSSPLLNHQQQGSSLFSQPQTTLLTNQHIPATNVHKEL